MYTIRDNVTKWNEANAKRLEVAKARLLEVSKADSINMDTPSGLTAHEQTRCEREALRAEVAIRETEARQAQGVLQSLGPDASLAVPQPKIEES